MTPRLDPGPTVVRQRPTAAVKVLGGLGELLLTLGVLLGLFVVWQLWWTDVLGARAQAAVVAELSWPAPPPAAAPAAPSAAAPSPAAPPVERHDAPPVIAEPAQATTFATLQVPRWGDVVSPISQGTARHAVLDLLGIGHYDGTAMPGAVGNFAVAGHRTTYGKPFNRIQELQVGDALVVRTETTWYVYRVTSTEIVSPRAVDVTSPVPGEPDTTPTLAQMTMTTCHPLFSARQRYIVHALLEGWLPVSDGTPAALAAVGPSDGGA